MTEFNIEINRQSNLVLQIKFKQNIHFNMNPTDNMVELTVNQCELTGWVLSIIVMNRIYFMI
jgi:hypothetical protein